MKLLNVNLIKEDEAVGDAAYAQELLNIQTWYNQEDQKLKNMLAKKRADALTKYQTRAKTTAANTTQSSQQSQQTKQTGTVDNSGRPVNANGNPPAVESYGDILKFKPINEIMRKPKEDEIRFTKNFYANLKPKANWYERPEAKEDYVEPTPTRKRKWTYKVTQQINDLEYQINDIKDAIKYTRESISSPSYPGIEGEIEDFFAEIGEKASEILNSGAYKNDNEKLEALKNAGVEDPKGILENYYMYYPEFNPALDKQRKESAKEISKLEEKIKKLENKIKSIESMYESNDSNDNYSSIVESKWFKNKKLNESSFDITDVDPQEFQRLKDYLDAENISYTEDEGGNEFSFDENELNKEWQHKIKDMGFKENYANDILSIEDEEDRDIVSKDEKIDEDKVFYVKIDDEGSSFIGKIYKLFDDGDWRSKIIDGESKTFEELNYDPNFDVIDIISFLRENYTDATLLSEKEFNDHVEEPEAEPEIEESQGLGGNGNTLDNQKPGEVVKRNESHEIPSLDDFINI